MNFSNHDNINNIQADSWEEHFISILKGSSSYFAAVAINCIASDLKYPEVFFLSMKKSLFWKIGEEIPISTFIRFKSLLLLSQLA